MNQHTPLTASSPSLQAKILAYRLIGDSVSGSSWDAIEVLRASLVTQMIKKLPTMRETQVRSLGQEDPMEKGMTAYSSILAQRIPWTEKPSGLQFLGSHRAGHDRATNTFNPGTVRNSLTLETEMGKDLLP